MYTDTMEQGHDSSGDADATDESVTFASELLRHLGIDLSERLPNNFAVRFQAAVEALLFLVLTAGFLYWTYLFVLTS